MYDYDEFEQWLRTATQGQMLRAILRNQWSMMDAQDLEIRLELKNMLNFDKMNAGLTRIGDLATSVKTAYDGVVVQRDAAVAELAAVKADDTADAEKLAAAEANLATAEAMLETLKAIATGTPVVLPPDTPPVGGQSTGGANPAID